MPKDQEQDEHDGRTKSEIPPEPICGRASILLRRLLVRVAGHGDPNDVPMRPA